MVMEILCSGSHFSSLQSEDPPRMFVTCRNGKFQGLWQKSTESLENVQGKKLAIIFSTNSRTVFRFCYYYYIYKSTKLHR